MDEISKIARDYDLRIIEDACQAHGAERHGLRAGQYGHLAAFSFYPGKNLGALGEGGAIVGNDPALVERVRLLRNWGSRVRYQHEVLAYNYRMDGIQGAVLDVKLRFLEEWTEGRRRVAALYDQAFDELGICRPQADSGRHVYHIYAIRVPDRSLVQHVLDEKGVQHAIHYPIPVHLQPAFSHIQVPRAHLPVSEKVADEWVSLPMDPLLTESEIDYVIESVTQAVS
jgi:dTDP-4-amino-4,6-dideoxygalactose transaminase